MEDSPDAPRFATVADRLRSKHTKFKGFKGGDVKEIIVSIQRFERDLVTITGDKVFLEQTPQIIESRISKNSDSIPKSILDSSMFSQFLPKQKAVKKKSKRSKKKG